MGTVYFACGCSVTREMGGGPILQVRVCSEHRKNTDVQNALGAQQAAVEALSQAMKSAHNDVSPMEIEQAARAASGERY